MESERGPLIERGVSVDDLRRLLRLDRDTGRLYWRPRPRSDFLRDRDYLGFCARLEGAEALTTHQRDGYRTGRVLGVRFFAHRVVYALHHGRWPVGLIDHRNKVRSDNRPDNLRDVGFPENARNHGDYRTNTSGVSGVSFHRRFQKWQAQIGRPGPGSHLGYFSGFEDAVAARRSEEDRRGYSVRGPAALGK